MPLLEKHDKIKSIVEKIQSPKPNNMDHANRVIMQLRASTA
jgi:hypothetical protein